MKGQEGGRHSLRRLVLALERYKYVLLVALVGVFLLLLPTGHRSGQSADGTPAAEQGGEEVVFDLTGTERKLSQALSQVEGAGQVSVVLTVRGSARQVLAQDGKTTWKEGASEQTAETVVVSKGSGTQEAVLVEQVYPDFQGALVVCTGGEDAGVRLKLVEAVSALTGLGADKISICKGK